jgi:formate transporter
MKGNGANMAEVTEADVSVIKPDCRSALALEQQAEDIAVGKANNTVGRTFVLAIMAGIMIGMGALFMTFVKADKTLGFAASSILGGLCFSLGLMCVIIAGSELFTGNCLMVIAAGSKRISWGAVVKNWVTVWIGNFAGSLILVGIVFGCGLMGTQAGDNTIGAQMVSVASGKIGLDPSQIFFRGIMCNLLVCLAVWMGFAGRTVIDKVFTSIFPVMAFVAMGFEHCVANMFFLPMGVIASQSGYGAVVLTWGGVFYNIGFATLGNIVGGAVFVGLIYWLAYHKKESGDVEAAR